MLFDMAEAEQVRTERRVVLGARGRQFNIDGTQFDYTEVFMTVPLSRPDDPNPMSWGLGVEVLKMPGSKHAMNMKQPDAFLAEVQIREFQAGKDVKKEVVSVKPLQLLGQNGKQSAASQPPKP